MLLGIVTQLEMYDFNTDHISHSAWVGILMKAALSSLIAIKALFDKIDIKHN